MKGQDTFTLVTYNIQTTHHPDKIVANVERMKEHGLSILCLQEVREVAGETFIGDQILQALGKDWQSVYFIEGDEKPASHGLAVFWDARVFTLKKAKKIFLPLAKRIGPVERLVRRTLGFSGEPSQRKALVCSFSAFGAQIRITNVHLDWEQGPQQRKAQLMYLMDHLKEEGAYAHECICGDFNTNHFATQNVEQFQLAEFFGKDYTDVTREIPWTIDWHNADFMGRFQFVGDLMKSLKIHYYQKLDYIWVRKLRAQKAEALQLSGSDHLPVLATLIVEA
jgi:endonuclease/exonuclease/phosphatase family metal-dependent hydrolase